MNLNGFIEFPFFTFDYQKYGWLFPHTLEANRIHKDQHQSSPGFLIGSFFFLGFNDEKLFFQYYKRIYDDRTFILAKNHQWVNINF
jgi:hypothetical protein